MIGLTKRQSDCLKAIKDLTVNGVAPTVEEIRERVGLASKCGVHRMLVALEERGHIRRIKYRNRAIEVLDPAAPERRIVFAPEPPREPIVQRIRAAGRDEFQVILKTVSDELIRRAKSA